MENVYLICSNSYYKCKENIESIIKDNLYSTYDLNIDLLEDVLEEAATIPLFDEKKYMVVKNAEVFGSEKRVRKSMQEILDKNEEDLTDAEKEKLEKHNSKDKMLLSYLEDPNPNTILIFCLYGKCDSKKKICKIIKEKHKLIDIPDLKPKEIRESVVQLFKKDKYKIDYETSNYIVASCLNNYDIAVMEVEKIKLYYNKPCEVMLKDVKNIVARNLEDSNFKFIDAVMKKDIETSFKIYEDLVLQRVEPIMLLSMLAKEIRNTLLVKEMLMSKSRREIMDTLGIKYDFQLDKMINNSYSFKTQELEELLIYLCDLDYSIKIGKVNNKMAMNLFILRICK